MPGKIPKPDTEELDIITWRHLSVLSAAYMNWANIRLWDLAPWIKAWFLDESFAGAWGSSAEDAYGTATIVEAEMLSGRMLSGTVADI